MHYEMSIFAAGTSYIVSIVAKNRNGDSDAVVLTVTTRWMSDHQIIIIRSLDHQIIRSSSSSSGEIFFEPRFRDDDHQIIMMIIIKKNHCHLYHHRYTHHQQHPGHGRASIERRRRCQLSFFSWMVRCDGHDDQDDGDHDQDGGM